VGGIKFIPQVEYLIESGWNATTNRLYGRALNSFQLIYSISKKNSQQNSDCNVWISLDL